MTAAILPASLLCAALGLALSLAPQRVPALAIAGAAAAVSVATVSIVRDTLVLGCWASVVATALSVHWRGKLGLVPAAILAVNAGLWIGAIAQMVGYRTIVLAAAPLALLCLPGAWLVSNGRAVPLKVIASWLTAIAALAIAQHLWPGPAGDHMQ